jgi:hypothetical protein
MSYYLLPGADAARAPTAPRVTAHLREPECTVSALQKILWVPCESSYGAGVPLTSALPRRLGPVFDAPRNDPRFQKRCEEKPEVTSREFFGKVTRRNVTVFDCLCVCGRVSDTVGKIG